MNEVVNLTSEQLGENEDQLGIQMDYAGTGKVSDAQDVGE